MYEISCNPHNAEWSGGGGGVAVFLPYHITGDVKSAMGLSLQKKKKDAAMIRRREK